ncbi:MAG TPA: hypothetical protein VMY37_20715 [Thermoguttaceae bacterium]|nr:hypothetical protein [Thermoguttaceae bacterium]
MTEDSDLNGLESLSTELEYVDESAPKKRPSRIIRLVGIASLALLLIVAVIFLTPSLRNDFLPRMAVKVGLMKAPPPPAEPEALPVVPILWQRLDLGPMPAEAAQELRQGKYYYEKRLPGNFGLAIDYWKKALARLGEEDHGGVQNLVTSAEEELARQFSADSSDAFVLIKQGKRDQATALLLRMRADYLDINAPQYIWASKMLYRRIR